MNRIVQLDKSVAEKIAAGEVVERPASAVKELLENAIDAGATAVTLEIQNGGVAFIRLTDNGGGILREDMPLAFARHATSKVRSAQDLDSIATLGFRGEALASISAVSHVEMLTRTANEVCGSRIEVDGGTIGVPQDAGCPQGTTVIVRELFYNTPARMKFLKKDVSEGNAVATVAERIALSHPEVSVKFIRDGRVQLHTPGDNKLISAIYGVFGRSFASSLIPADYELSGVKVGGYVSKPVDSRGSRSMQIFYINGRLVRSKTAVAAIEEAYKGSVMTGRYPACVLTLSLSPALVDVNVHPAKLEVRFANEKQIFDAVYYAAKNALASLDTRPEMELKQRRERTLFARRCP
jgi:DNA mismatch repair protein MutL